MMCRRSSKDKSSSRGLLVESLPIALWMPTSSAESEPEGDPQDNRQAGATTRSSGFSTSLGEGSASARRRARCLRSRRTPSGCQNGSGSRSSISSAKDGVAKSFLSGALVKRAPYCGEHLLPSPRAGRWRSAWGTVRSPERGPFGFRECRFRRSRACRRDRLGTHTSRQFGGATSPRAPAPAQGPEGTSGIRAAPRSTISQSPARVGLRIIPTRPPPPGSATSCIPSVARLVEPRTWSDCLLRSRHGRRRRTQRRQLDE